MNDEFDLDKFKVNLEGISEIKEIELSFIKYLKKFKFESKSLYNFLIRSIFMLSIFKFNKKYRQRKRIKRMY
jgi:hypothetical protein